MRHDCNLPALSIAENSGAATILSQAGGRRNTPRGCTHGMQDGGRQSRERVRWGAETGTRGLWNGAGRLFILFCYFISNEAQGITLRVWRCKASVSLWSAKTWVRVPREAVDFYLQSQLVFSLFDGVPLTPMSSHCWHVKEPYHSVRVQVMGSGRPTQSKKRKQYVCACLWVSGKTLSALWARSNFTTCVVT